MSFTELFSPSFFISVAALFLVVSLVMTYINYRMSEQDHKISSMLGLISTMAQELEFFRSKLANSSSVVNMIPFTSEKNLIHVSDDEDDDEDEDDDDDLEEDSESESESEPESDLEEELVTTDHIKILNIHLPNESNIIDITNELDELDDQISEDDLDINEDEYDNISSESEIKITEIHLLSDHDDTNDASLFKSIHVEEIDYKKMPLQKLRDLALQKGLTNDASKLKKNDIIKLISSV